MLDHPGARLLLILFLVTGAGGFGGLLNAVVSGVRPDQPPAAMLNGQPVLVPGSLGNVLVGAAAALISFGLYGPLTNLTVISLGSRSDLPSQGPMPGLTVAALAGAILVGFSGGRWLTSEAEKQYSKATSAVLTRIAEFRTTAPQASETGTLRSAASESLGTLADSIQTQPAHISYAKALQVLSQIRQGGGTSH